jgi:hypothetical protein
VEDKESSRCAREKKNRAWAILSTQQTKWRGENPNSSLNLSGFFTSSGLVWYWSIHRD